MTEYYHLSTDVSCRNQIQRHSQKSANYRTFTGFGRWTRLFLGTEAASGKVREMEGCDAFDPDPALRLTGSGARYPVRKKAQQGLQVWAGV